MATAKWDGKRWRLRVTENGVTRSFQSYTPGRKGKKEVEDKAARIARLDDVCQFFVAWERYLEEVGALTGPENYTNTESIGRNYILPILGQKKLPELRITDFQKILYTARKRNGEPLAKKSISNIRGVMVNFGKFCLRSRLWDLDLSELRIPKNAPKKGKVILQPEEAARLFEDFNDDWYINLWRWLLATGCRPGEALGLKWDDIKDGTVTIRRAINYRNRVTEGKNENARRSFRLNSILEKILRDQRDKTWRLRSDYVFCNHAGQHAKQTATKNSWDEISRQIGTEASPYSLRHTFISFMAQALPEQALKALVGHSVNMDTYGVYGHAVNGDDDRIATSVNSILRARLGQD